MSRMSEFYDKQIEELHQKLAHLYRGKSTDTVRINGIWARIERLEQVNAKLIVKEGKNNGN